MAKITIMVVPAAGKATSVDLDASGVSVGEALKKAGYDAKAFIAKIDGTTVSMDAHAPDGAKITLTEKVKGS